LFLPPINSLFVSFRWPAWMRYIMLLVSTSLIASLISSPITLAYFGQASAVTVFSNMIVVPLVSLAVIGIMILLLVFLAWPAAAILPGMILDRLLRLTADTVAWFDRFDWAEITVPSIPAGYVLAALATVCCLFAAIRHRAARRLVVFMIIGGAAVQVAMAIGRPAHPPDLEVFNEGLSPTVIINAGPGVVIHRATGSSRYDEFTGGVLPYLTGRGNVLPRGYVFFEPRYQTEARLVRWADAGIGFPLIYSAAPDPLSQPAVYLRSVSGDPSRDRDAEVAGTIRIGPDAAIVTTVDSCRFVFGETIESVRCLGGMEAGMKTCFFVFADTDGELRNAAAELGYYPLVIILTRRSEYYKLLSDKGLDDFYPDFWGHLVEKGTSISLKRGEVGRLHD
jgi:hypothetical protein